MTWAIISVFAGLALVVASVALVVRVVGEFEVRVPPRKEDIVIRFGRRGK